MLPRRNAQARLETFFEGGVDDAPRYYPTSGWRGLGLYSPPRSRVLCPQVKRFREFLFFRLVALGPSVRCPGVALAECSRFTPCHRCFVRCSSLTHGLHIRSAAQPNRLLLYTGLAAGAGILTVSAVQWTAGSGTDSEFSDPVTRRLRGTYGYLALSLGATVSRAKHSHTSRV
jgi:hypothetical protein